MSNGYIESDFVWKNHRWWQEILFLITKKLIWWVRVVFRFFKLKMEDIMEQKKPYLLNVKFLRKLLIGVDDLIHFAVAMVLAICGVLILIQTIPNFLHPDLKTLLHVLNDVLLVLIVVELMWPIIRFLKREPFILNPFLYIGIISCIRRILLIEAEHSIVSQTANYKPELENLWPVLAEMGSNVFIILVLAVSLRILTGCQEKAKRNQT